MHSGNDSRIDLNQSINQPTNGPTNKCTITHSWKSARTFAADDKDLSPRRKYDYLVCREMASHVSNTKQLPIECAKYLDIVSMVQRRETDRSHGSDVLS